MSAEEIECGLKLKYGFIIIPSSRDYTLYKRVKVRDRETKEFKVDEDGKPIYGFKRIGYYSKITCALESYRRELVRMQLTKRIYELDELIDVVKKADEAFSEMMKKLGVL